MSVFRLLLLTVTVSLFQIQTKRRGVETTKHYWLLKQVFHNLGI